MRTERTVGTPGEPTDKFLGYCERMIELMRQHGVTPVLVFDGAPPAMKARLNPIVEPLVLVKGCMGVGEGCSACCVHTGLDVYGMGMHHGMRTIKVCLSEEP